MMTRQEWTERIWAAKQGLGVKGQVADEGAVKDLLDMAFDCPFEALSGAAARALEERFPLLTLDRAVGSETLHETA